MEIEELQTVPKFYFLFISFSYFKQNVSLIPVSF